MANLMSFMNNTPLYVRYGLKYRIKLLWDYGVSKAFKSVHPRGNPMSHSTHVGFSWPPFPCDIFRRSSSVICPACCSFFNCWKFPVPPHKPAPVVGVGHSSWNLTWFAREICFPFSNLLLYAS